MTDYKIKRDQHMKITDAHRREDIVNNQTYVLVQIPDDIKNTVTTPEWLTNWEEAEFMSAGGMYGKPHGWDIENVTVRAAYWLALMTSGIWLDDKEEEYVKRDSYVDNVIAYYNTGNSRYLIGTEFSYSNNSSTKTSIILQASEITSPQPFGRIRFDEPQPSSKRSKR